METITVFTGMEVHDYAEMTVLKTYANGTKLCFFDFGNDDEDEVWDELWIAQQDERFGWYGIDSKPVRVNLGTFTQGWLTKLAEFDR